MSSNVNSSGNGQKDMDDKLDEKESMHMLVLIKKEMLF